MHWNKIQKGKTSGMMEYFSPGDIWATYTYKPENRPPDMRHCSRSSFRECNGEAKKDLHERRQGKKLLLDPEH